MTGVKALTPRLAEYRADCLHCLWVYDGSMAHQCAREHVRDNPTHHASVHSGVVTTYVGA